MLTALLSLLSTLVSFMSCISHYN